MCGDFNIDKKPINNLNEIILSDFTFLRLVEGKYLRSKTDWILMNKTYKYDVVQKLHQYSDHTSILVHLEIP